jgi:hypothetical protein
MCGRARLSTDVSEIKLVFSIPPGVPVARRRATGRALGALRPEPSPTLRSGSVSAHPGDDRMTRAALCAAAAGADAPRCGGSGGVVGTRAGKGKRAEPAR